LKEFFMSQIKHHFFVCMNQRPPGHPRGSCGARGAAAIMDRIAGEIEKRGLWSDALVTATGCLGPCDKGTTVVVYPDGVWYGNLQPEDIEEIFDQHVGNGEPVARLRFM